MIIIFFFTATSIGRQSDFLHETARGRQPIETQPNSGERLFYYVRRTVLRFYLLRYFERSQQPQGFRTFKLSQLFTMAVKESPSFKKSLLVKKKMFYMNVLLYIRQLLVKKFNLMHSILLYR